MQLRNLLMNIEVYCLSVNLASHSALRTCVHETAEYSRRKVSSLQCNSINYMILGLAIIKRERSNENYSHQITFTNTSVELNIDIVCYNKKILYNNTFQAAARILLIDCFILFFYIYTFLLFFKYAFLDLEIHCKSTL